MGQPSPEKNDFRVPQRQKESETEEVETMSKAVNTKILNNSQSYAFLVQGVLVLEDDLLLRDLLHQILLLILKYETKIFILNIFQKKFSEMNTTHLLYLSNFDIHHFIYKKRLLHIGGPNNKKKITTYKIFFS